MVPDARSAWVNNGVAISPNATNYKPFILSDGANGTIVAWYGGSGSDIFAQRLLVGRLDGAGLAADGSADGVRRRSASRSSPSW